MEIAEIIEFWFHWFEWLLKLTWWNKSEKYDLLQFIVVYGCGMLFYKKA